MEQVIDASERTQQAKLLLQEPPDVGPTQRADTILRCGARIDSAANRLLLFGRQGRGWLATPLIF